MTRTGLRLRRTVARIWRDDDGGLTLFSMFMFTAMVLIGGLAVDITNAARAHTQLQNAADLAGNMALYWREQYGEETAKAKAIEVANLNMPVEMFGEVLTPEDVRFGTWDGDTETFTESADSPLAVIVETRRIAERANALPTFILRLLGIDTIDLDTASIWETYDKGCLREGFVAQGLIDLQSNNDYSDGFCIHSNTMISINQNNSFELGTIVSIPSETALDLPRSGYEKNAGLREALQIGPHLLRVFNQLQNDDGSNGPLLTKLMTGTDETVPRWYDPTLRTPTGAATHTISLSGGNPKVRMADFKPGMINVMTCGGSGRVTVEDTLENVIVTTNCKVKFSSGAALQNARLITTSTDDDSVNAPSGMRIGLNDDCAEGGDAQIITLGGVSFASGLEAFGAQIVAMGDIRFSANANGIEGAAFTAMGEIHGTSNMEFGFCGDDAPSSIRTSYFRMVR